MWTSPVGCQFVSFTLFSTGIVQKNLVSNVICWWCMVLVIVLLMISLGSLYTILGFTMVVEKSKGCLNTVVQCSLLIYLMYSV